MDNVVSTECHLYGRIRISRGTRESTQTAETTLRWIPKFFNEHVNHASILKGNRTRRFLSRYYQRDRPSSRATSSIAISFAVSFVKPWREVPTAAFYSLALIPLPRSVFIKILRVHTYMEKSWRTLLHTLLFFPRVKAIYRVYRASGVSQYHEIKCSRVLRFRVPSLHERATREIIELTRAIRLPVSFRSACVIQFCKIKKKPIFSAK